MMATCPRHYDVERWAHLGSGATLPSDLAEHIDHCEPCAAMVEDVLELRALAAELPVHELSRARRESLRFDLMAAARRRTVPPEAPRRWPARRATALVAAAAAVLAAVLGAAIFARSQGDGEQRPPGRQVAEIVLEEGARGETVTPGPDEIYRLVRGAARFEVRRLQEGERFRVLAGDGVVEVRGTAFRVEVRQGRLVGVRVTHGRVVVDVGDRRVASLTAGERWDRDDRSAVAANLPGPPPPGPAPRSSDHAQVLEQSDEPPPTDHGPVRGRGRSGPSSRGAPDLGRDEPAVATPPPRPLDETTDERPPSPPRPREGEDERPSEPQQHREAGEPPTSLSDEAFASAWRALRDGRSAEAARGFDAIWAQSALDPDRRADVLYWAAVAHRRAGDLAGSAARAAVVVREHPTSWHAADAALLVGEHALREGRAEDARDAFELAARQGRGAVRDRALRALGRLRTNPSAEE